MSTTPIELLNLAHDLAKCPDGQNIQEANLRCSTSRAYYAALHAADVALPPDLAVTAAERRSKSSHQAVIDAVVVWSKAIRPGRTEAISVARKLPKLRDFRKRADYHIQSEYTVEEAQNALNIAQDAIQSASRAHEQSSKKEA